jgi:FdhD protein
MTRPRAINAASSRRRAWRRTRRVPAREAGIEIRLWLRKTRRPAYRARRRRLAGPLGCGLCGIESLDQAVRSCPPVTGLDGFEADDIARAIAALGQSQTLNREAHALHAAGFFVPMRGLVGLREDVGRHNALDKLAGALAVGGIAGATGAVVITSRVSVEMVQKTAAIGSPVLIAVSVPTALAIRHAADAGITLVAVARGAAFEIFSHRERISGLGSTP